MRILAWSSPTLVRELATSGPRKDNVLGGRIALGLTPTPKIEPNLASHPKERVKAKRNLEDMVRVGAKEARKEDAPLSELGLNLLLSLPGEPRPRARKTGNPAGTTSWDLAQKEPNAIIGIHQYVNIGARALAVRVIVAAFFTMQKTGEETG